MRMYVCTLKNIYSSRCSHIAVHGWTEYALENAVVYIHSQQWERKDEIALRCTIDTVGWIELQWSENLST